MRIMTSLNDRYRPTTLNDVHGQDSVVRVLRSFLEKGEIPHLLFCGLPGTGKTSTIHALARELYGEHAKSTVLLLNASDDRGISVIRTHIKTFARLKNHVCPDKPKLIILDEADSMTFDAQSALRRVMEKHTKVVRFCLICNYINKLIPALQSRCTVFRFNALTYESVKPLLKTMCKEEKLKLSPALMKELVELSKGDLRKCVNFIESHHKLNVDRSDLIQYYFCIDLSGFQAIEALVNSTATVDVYASLTSIRDKYHLTPDVIIDVISYIALGAKKYELMVKLADIEYLLFKCRHTFEEVFIRSIAMALCSF